MTICTANIGSLSSPAMPRAAAVARGRPVIWHDAKEVKGTVSRHFSYLSYGSSVNVAIRGPTLAQKKSHFSKKWLKFRCTHHSKKDNRQWGKIKLIAIKVDFASGLNKFFLRKNRFCPIKNSSLIENHLCFGRFFYLKGQYCLIKARLWLYTLQIPTLLQEG